MKNNNDIQFINNQFPLNKSISSTKTDCNKSNISKNSRFNEKDSQTSKQGQNLAKLHRKLKKHKLEVITTNFWF